VKGYTVPSPRKCGEREKSARNWTMKMEIQTAVGEIKASLDLLRRHL
jgi:hypothetical protein